MSAGKGKFPHPKLKKEKTLKDDSIFPLGVLQCLYILSWFLSSTFKYQSVILG